VKEMTEWREEVKNRKVIIQLLPLTVNIVNIFNIFHFQNYLLLFHKNSIQLCKIPLNFGLGASS
jgi:hypothetical protein